LKHIINRYEQNYGPEEHKDYLTTGSTPIQQEFFSILTCDCPVALTEFKCIESHDLNFPQQNFAFSISASRAIEAVEFEVISFDAFNRVLDISLVSQHINMKSGQSVNFSVPAPTAESTDKATAYVAYVGRVRLDNAEIWSVDTRSLYQPIVDAGFSPSTRQPSGPHDETPAL